MDCITAKTKEVEKWARKIRQAYQDDDSSSVRQFMKELSNHVDELEDEVENAVPLSGWVVSRNYSSQQGS